jgi:hypothetical protein
VITEPPSDARVHSTVTSELDYETRVGAADTVGFDAKVKVFLIEKSPVPASVTARTLYWMSYVELMPVCVNIKVFRSVEPTFVHC